MTIIYEGIFYGKQQFFKKYDPYGIRGRSGYAELFYQGY